MKQNYVISISLIIILLLMFSSHITIPGHAQTFSGKRTDSMVDVGTFESPGVCMITWATGEVATGTTFFFDIFRERNEYGSKLGSIGTFRGNNNGMTYIYAVGNYTLAVNSIYVDSWYISIQPIPREQLEPNSHFYGSDHKEAKGVYTGIFTCSGLCEITWTPPSPEGKITANIFKLMYPGLMSQKTSHIATIEDARGTTYLFDEGTFFFQVAASANTWEITVKNIDMAYLEQMEPKSHFTGAGSNITEIFTCSGHCSITWETEYDPSPVYRCARCIISIKKIGEQEPIKTIRGYCNGPYECYDLNGTTDLNEKGTFYFVVDAQSIERWTIDVEDVPQVSEGDSHFFLIGGLLSGFFVLTVIHCSRHRRSK